MPALQRLMHAWNAFTGTDPDRMSPHTEYYGPYAYGAQPGRVRLNISNERSIVTSIYTRMSVDVSRADIRHVRLDDQNRYKEDIESSLNECLTLEANQDQTTDYLIRDLVMTLCEKGVAAVVPVDTTLSPNETGGYDIKTLRVGEITQWYPRHVKISLFNEKKMDRQEIVLEKKFVAIIHNPLFAVMNEPSSTLQRLIAKLNLLDTLDSKTASGKLDLMIKLPYQIKSETRRAQVSRRKKEINEDLTNSQYGIAFIDSTENVTQLNRPAENQLLAQVEFLLTMLYGQLGITPEVMNGTADEAVMLNYNNRTIEPILTAIQLEMKRKFLTKTARSQKQSIMYFQNPFRYMPISDIAETADKFTRNEIMSSNEFRQVIGMKPSADPKADELRNSNMPQSELGTEPPGEGGDGDLDASLAALEASLDEMEALAGEEPNVDEG